LARYTGNATFADTAEDLWAWLEAIELIDTETWAVHDGALVDSNCTDINKVQFSYSSAVLTHGAAVMYNHVGPS
jgi:mannan endo-1,6-alpha-mannosidase